MKEVRIPDRDIVLAAFPDGHTSWTLKAQTQWLKEHGIIAPYTHYFDKATGEHVYEMHEQE